MARQDVLITTDELDSTLNDTSLRVVEVDEDVTLYEKGHIPGSISWDWKRDLHDPVRREVIDEQAVTDLLGRSGVGPQTTIVLYGGNNNWFATYAYWLLRYRGFDKVKILDGGRKKWELESRLLTQEAPEAQPAKERVQLEGTRRELRALRDEVLQSLGGEVGLIDVRSPEEYSGQVLAPAHLPQEQAQVPGHIPGAVNIPWSKGANEDGTFRSEQELKALFEDQEIDGTKPVIAYCRIGERSSFTWFVLHELLGYEDVRNYDGSWTEYGSLVGVPVEI